MTVFLANRLLLRVGWTEKLGPGRPTNYKLTFNVASEPRRWDSETEANTTGSRSQQDDSTSSPNYIILCEIGTCSFRRKLMGVLLSVAETPLTHGGAICNHHIDAQISLLFLLMSLYSISKLRVVR